MHLQGKDPAVCSNCSPLNISCCLRMAQVVKLSARAALLLFPRLQQGLPLRAVVDLPLLLLEVLRQAASFLPLGSQGPALLCQLLLQALLAHLGRLQLPLSLRLQCSRQTMAPCNVMDREMVFSLYSLFLASQWSWDPAWGQAGAT